MIVASLITKFPLSEKLIEKILVHDYSFMNTSDFPISIPYHFRDTSSFKSIETIDSTEMMLSKTIFDKVKTNVLISITTAYYNEV